jgi:hypothetical protein
MYGIPDSSMIHRQFTSNSSPPVLMGRWTEQKGGKCRTGENYYALIQPGGSTLSDYLVRELDQEGGTYSYDQRNSNGQRGANIVLNAPVMDTYPTAQVLTKGIQTLAVPALVAAFIVVYALDWASRDEDLKADDYTRRVVYLVVNTLILWLTVSGVITLEDLGLG